MTNKETVYKQSEEIYRKNNLVISREYGQTLNGNSFNGSWVVRNINTGEYVDHDRYCNDLFERHGFNREEFSDSKELFEMSVVALLKKNLSTFGFKFNIPFGKNKLCIRHTGGEYGLQNIPGSTHVYHFEVNYFESMEEDGFYSTQPQYFHLDDINEAIDCFVSRAKSLRPYCSYDSKHCLSIEDIHNRTVEKTVVECGKFQGKVAFEDVISPRVKMEIYMGEVGDKANLKAKLTGLLDAAMVVNNPLFGHMWKDVVLGLFDKHGWFEEILNQPYRNKSILVIEAGRVPEVGKFDDMQLSFSFIPAVSDHGDDSPAVAGLVVESPITIPVAGDESSFSRTDPRVLMCATLDLSCGDEKGVANVLKQICNQIVNIKGYSHSLTPEYVFNGLVENYLEKILSDNNRKNRRLFVVFEQSKVYCIWGEELPHTLD